MNKVDISFLNRFKSHNKLFMLNDYILKRDRLMPHEIAVATGCSLSEATTLLIFLYHLYLAEPYLLTYHNQHPLIVIDKTKLKDGLPKLPITCDYCEDEISGQEELIYEFEFILKDNIQFYAG